MSHLSGGEFAEVVVVVLEGGEAFEAEADAEGGGGGGVGGEGAGDVGGVEAAAGDAGAAAGEFGGEFPGLAAEGVIDGRDVDGGVGEKRVEHAEEVAEGGPGGEGGFEAENFELVEGFEVGRVGAAGAIDLAGGEEAEGEAGGRGLERDCREEEGDGEVVAEGAGGVDALGGVDAGDVDAGFVEGGAGGGGVDDFGGCRWRCSRGSRRGGGR